MSRFRQLRKPRDVRTSAATGDRAVVRTLGVLTPEGFKRGKAMEAAE
jgi:hypothetical protein